MIKRILLYISSLTVLLMPAIPATVYAQVAESNKDAACEGLALTGSGCSSPDSASSSINSTIKLVINVLSLIVGVAAVIMIIIGGFKYVTSQGDGNNTASAKNTILYAVVGLVVVALAQVIVRFVLSKTD